MSDFREVLAAPYAVYVAPSNTTFPAIDDDESAFAPAWVLLGTNGTANYATTGVVIALNETITSFTGAGSTRPVNSWRTDEGGTVDLSLADMSIEQLAIVLDDAAVTTVPASTGIAGQKSISLDRGVQTHKYAVLARGLSPETTPDAPMFAQLQISRASQSGNQTLTYTKGTPTELAVQFTILQNLQGGTSVDYIAGTAPAL